MTCGQQEPTRPLAYTAYNEEPPWRGYPAEALLSAAEMARLERITTKVVQRAWRTGLQ